MNNDFLFGMKYNEIIMSVIDKGLLDIAEGVELTSVMTSAILKALSMSNETKLLWFSVNDVQPQTYERVLLRNKNQMVVGGYTDGSNWMTDDGCSFHATQWAYNL